ncbi:uncharacterized protein LOC143421484 [Maylandia zebra]|uniref:uncharacterized protein LOC143421484 n=1 Tax=Maylandia zebra TaxID=106582 RepID=UPI00403C76BC
MTEPSRGLFYLPIIYLWTGGVEGDVLASLAPPVHLSGERLGWTLLVCIVNDFRRGHLEVSWSSASEGHMPTTPYSIALTRKHNVPNVVAVITVTTRDWPSYSCSVSRKRHSKSKRRRRITSSDHQDKLCHEEEKIKGIDVWTNTVVILVMRLLLMKILAFDTLMTIYVVIK